MPKPALTWFKAAFVPGCIAAVALVSFQPPPALAAHCPRGQLYRVSMGRCVPKESRLGREVVGERLARIRRPFFPILRAEPDYYEDTPIPAGRGETPRISP
jgi:hypothetical protein